MAGTGKKWAIGCGIGCGFLLLMLGGVGTCGYFGVRRIVDRAELIEESFEILDTEYGHAREFTPDPEGRISPQRMEIFLAARDACAVSRLESASLINTLDEERSGNGPGNMIERIKAGIRFIPAMLAFVEERNRVLMEEGMGLGEYQYIYSLAYFGHLEKDPADGPGFTVSGPDDEEEQHGPVRFNMNESDDDPESVRDEREKEIRRYLNDTLGPAVQNQLEALEARLSGSSDPDLLEWRRTLAAEAEAMEREPRRILWDEGLPLRLSESIEPYRARLEESYNEMMNVVEMGMVKHN